MMETATGAVAVVCPVLCCRWPAGTVPPQRLRIWLALLARLRMKALDMSRLDVFNAGRFAAGARRPALSAR
jgi:hypothetical protein